MQTDNLSYDGVKKLIDPYGHKGRSESASFLNWFLENVYRLGDVEADDAICDEHNDKGIDGIYVDNTAQEVHFFQSKITQKDGRTIGDADLKAFIGALDQFRTAKSIEKLLDGNANEDLKKIIRRERLAQLIEDGYKVRPVYVGNLTKDTNTEEYLKHQPDFEIYDIPRIILEHIDFDSDEGVKGKFDFDISYAGCLEVQGEGDVKTFLFPAKSLELVKLDGIVDDSLFKQNVRLTLGNTSVNAGIADSIKDQGEHKNFPLYHNGITMLCDDAQIIEGDRLQVKDYVVVNGAQSISTFYKNAASLSEDLRVFVKVVALRDEQLARKITVNSNNQNSIKARDLRSNHALMLRLKAEFEKEFPEYHFEIKRGEAAEAGKQVITNELAARLLLAFDLDEPYSSHQIYKLFDDKYADIFGRPEVSAARIVFLLKVYEQIKDRIHEIGHNQMAGYALTNFFVLNVLRHVMEKSDRSYALIRNRAKMPDAAERDAIMANGPDVLGELLVDLKYAIGEKGDNLDYKSDLKSPEEVRKLRNSLVSSYEKEMKKGKATTFD
jgi:hypothetical protein